MSEHNRSARAAQISEGDFANPQAPRLKFWALNRGQLLLLGATLMLILLAMLGLAVQNNFARLQEANRWNIHTYRVLERIHRVSALLDAQEAQLRGFALTGDLYYLQQLRKTTGLGALTLKELENLTRDRAQQQQRLARIEPEYSAYKQRFVTPFRRVPQSDSEAARFQSLVRAQTVARGRESRRLQTGLQQVEATERQLLETRALALALAQNAAKQTLIGGSVFVILLAVWLTILLGRAARAQQDASAQMSQLNESLIGEVAERRTAEESLRASEAGFRHLAEDSLDMICRHAPDGTLTYVSPAAWPLLGYKPAEMIGVHPARFRFDKIPHDDNNNSSQEQFAAQLRDTHHKALLRCYRHADGHKVWLEVVGHAIVDSESGEVRAWHTAARDVSARVREEKERARLLAGLRAVVEIADDLIAAPGEDELLKRAVEMMRSRVGIKRCSIYLATPDEAGENEFSSLMRGTFGTDENGKAVAENELLYDIQNDPNPDDITPAPGERWIVRRNQTRHFWRDGKRVELPARGWLARTPIATRDHVIGLFFHDSAATGAPHDVVEQQLIAVFCSLLGALIERGRSQARMNRQQQLLQSVMENAPLLLYSVDRNARFTLATGNALPVIGLDATQLLGRSMLELVPPDSSSVLGMKRALSGETMSEEMEFGGRWLKMWRQPLRDDDDEICGMIGIGLDITQQHRAQSALQESETRYRQVADSLQDVLFQTDARGFWTFLNPAWSEITGYAVESSLATPGNKTVHPDDRAQFDALLAAMQTPATRNQTPAARQRVVRLVTRQNQVRWIQITLRANFDRDGIFVGTAGTLSDVTEKVISENKLRETLELKRAILQGASYAIVSTDARGIIQTFNPAAAALFGASEQEVVGKVNLTAFHDTAELAMRAPEMARKRNETVASEFEILVARAHERGTDEAQWKCVRADGTTFPMRISHSVLRDSAGAIAGYVSIGYDLTETQRAENLKNEFVSVVSHELRTPLTSIRGALGLLSGGVAGELPASARQMIDIAQKNADRLVLLINDILDIEKIESGKMRFEMNEVPLASLLENALESNRGYAQTLGVHLELEPLALALQNATVAGDEARLQQVMSNLISNACKWTPTGTTVKLRAQLSAHAASENARVCIEVQDAGPGVPSEFESRLFERFAQADGSATREKGGTGLGLAVTQAIVEKHGGCVGYRAPDAASGRVGATFYFELPARQVAAPIVEMQPSARRMLVVEDDEEVAAVLRAVLENAGYTVAVAASRAQALQIAREGARNGASFDAATLDLHLPDGHGLELLEELRALPGVGALPVVVISGFCDEQTSALAQHQIEHWFSKPVAPTQLLAAIAACCPDANNARARAKSGDKARVLHVEDDRDISHVVAMILDGSSDITTASSMAQARQRLNEEKFDLVLIDIGLPDGNGLELVEHLAAQEPPVPTIIFSAREAEAEAASNVAAALIKSRTPNEELRAKVEELLKK